MKKETFHLLKEYLTKWNLQTDDDFFFTHTSLLQPVIYMNEYAMLKISLTDEEKQGSELMA